MFKVKSDQVSSDKSDAVSTYCMGSLVADQASRGGYKDFARSMEEALSGLLESLPRDQQKQALSLAYEMALAGDTPAPPGLRLVYSRD